MLSSNYVPIIEAKVAEWEAEFDSAEATRQTEFDSIKSAYELALHDNTNVEIIVAMLGPLYLLKISRSNKLPKYYLTQICKYIV